MNKFWALTITAKLEIKRVWMDSAMAIAFLKENEGSKLFRSSTDQCAEVVNDELVWKDVIQQG